MDASTLTWLDKGLRLGQFTLVEEFGTGIASAAEEYPNFILMKGRDCINGYLEVLPQRDRYDDVLELGIMKGGSCVLFNELLKPARHMAVDISQPESGLPQFTDYVAAQGRKFHALHRVSQDDDSTIASTYESAFATKAEFDLIVDDASHNYALSLASFNSLFPRMKVGGIYALEDWGWGHWGGRFQEGEHPEYKNPALSNLAVHALLAVTGAGNIVSTVIAKPNTVFVFRGPAPIPENFRIEKAVLMRNRATLLY